MFQSLRFEYANVFSIAFRCLELDGAVMVKSGLSLLLFLNEHLVVLQFLEQTVLSLLLLANLIL